MDMWRLYTSNQIPNQLVFQKAIMRGDKAEGRPTVNTGNSSKNSIYQQIHGNSFIIYIPNYKYWITIVTISYYTLRYIAIYCYILLNIALFCEYFTMYIYIYIFIYVYI